MRSFLLLGAALIVMAGAAQGQFLTASPDPANIIHANKDNTAVLTCSTNATDDVSWVFVDTQSGQEKTLSGDVVSEDEDDGSSVLTLKDFAPGQYLCRAGGEEANFTVVNYFRLEKLTGFTVAEGDDGAIRCALKPGSDLKSNPVFKWERVSENEDADAAGEEVVSADDADDGPTIDQDEGASTLKFADVEMDDRDVYRCVVTNDYGQELSTQTTLRVRDKLGAIYPFLGILAEVVLLVVIIFLCEKRSKSKEAAVGAAAEDDDGEFDGRPSAEGSNVRMRRS